MFEIFTASWFTKLPPDVVRVGISRGAPRRFPAGYRRFTALNPGVWFNNVDPATYLRLYNEEVLDRLDPCDVAARLEDMTEGKPAALCCYESTSAIANGSTWCHRSLVAYWLQDRLGIEVREIDAPAGFNPFLHLERQGIDPPSYR